MRQYAWYSPKFNIICLQAIIEGCRIAFELDWHDSAILTLEFGYDEDPISKIGWIPLGEL